MKFSLFTQVRLIEDLPEYGLSQGDLGTIVEHYSNPEGEDGYSLEGLIPLNTVEVSESQIKRDSTARVVIDTMLSIEDIGMNGTNSRGGHRTIPCCPLY
jgi:hypothetical protein